MDGAPMPSAHSFTLALVPMGCVADTAADMAAAVRRVRDAARAGAQIVCLPELFLGPYFCQRVDLNNFDLAEPIPGPSSDRLAALAKETGTVIVSSLFEKRATGLYHNAAAVFDTDGTL